jgi:hypothetical protein
MEGKCEYFDKQSRQPTGSCPLAQGPGESLELLSVKNCYEVFHTTGSLERSKQ